MNAAQIVMRELRLSPADVARMLGAKPPGDCQIPDSRFQRAREVKRRARGGGPMGRLRKGLAAKDRAVLAAVELAQPVSALKLAVYLNRVVCPVFYGHLAALVKVGWLTKTGRNLAARYRLSASGAEKLAEAKGSR